MSENFNKICYTSRSSGYKYRTLSTNTGERKRRNSREDSAVDKKFKDLKREIVSRVNNQLDETQRARESLKEKLETINLKIDSILALQNTVALLRNDLHIAEGTLGGMLEKVERLEAMGSGAVSLQTRKSSVRCSPILEVKDK